MKDLNAAFERDKMLTTKFERQIEEVEKIFSLGIYFTFSMVIKVKRHQDSPYLSLLYYSIKQFLGADHLLMAILKVFMLSLISIILSWFEGHCMIVKIICYADRHLQGGAAVWVGGWQGGGGQEGASLLDEAGVQGRSPVQPSGRRCSC